jgi:hypothetical protein
MEMIKGCSKKAEMAQKLPINSSVIAMVLLLCACPFSSATSHEKSKEPIKLEADQNSFELGTTESVLEWDRWHHKVGRALSQAVHKYAGKLMGTASIRITIDKEQNLTAEVVKQSGNPELAQACLNAATTLDKNEILIFPYGSKRPQVRFNFEYKRAFFVVPKHEYIKNDYETLSD